VIGVTGWLATVKRMGEAGTDGFSLFVAASGILFCFLLPASADVEKFRREVCCSGPREGEENDKKDSKVGENWPSLALSRSVSKFVLSGWAR
jgi:hypothetical protein